MIVWLWTLLLALGFTFSSCATLPTPPEGMPDPQALLARLRDRGQRIQGLKGLARVKILAPGKNYYGSEVLWVYRPSSLRLESLGPMGTPQLYLTTDGREARLYSPGENRFYAGPVTDRLLASVLPLSFPLEDFISVLLGDVPGHHEEGRVFARRDEGEGQWIFEMDFPSRREIQTLWVEPTTLRVKKAQIRSSRLSYEVIFGDFRVGQGLDFPWQIQLTVPEQNLQMTAGFEEIELNPRWEGGEFSLPIPRGAKVIPWE
jgi:outer membrane biogenesis lipoprotein LolB